MWVAKARNDHAPASVRTRQAEDPRLGCCSLACLIDEDVREAGEAGSPPECLGDETDRAAAGNDYTGPEDLLRVRRPEDTPCRIKDAARQDILLCVGPGRPRVVDAKEIAPAQPPLHKPRAQQVRGEG